MQPIFANIREMTARNIVTTLKTYQKASAKSKKRKDYLREFEVTMIYRTTKSENPMTTKHMVKTVLGKLR